MSNDAAIPSLTRFVMFPCAAVGGTIALLVLSPDLTVGWGIAGVLAVGYAWYCLGGCYHEMTHETLLPGSRWNQIIGKVIGTVIFTPYSAYRETHRTHHARLNTPDDWELWPYCDPNVSRRRRQRYVWFDLLLAIITEPIQYGRIQFSRRSPLDAATRRGIRHEYYACLALWIGFIAGGISLANARIISGQNLLVYGLGPLWVGSFLNKIRMMVEHMGLASFDPLLGTRTIIHGNLLTRISGYFNFELCIHGPHHRYPKIRHTGLADKWEECVQKRPEVAALEYHSFASAFRAMLPYLLFNPGVGMNVASESGTMATTIEQLPPQDLAA